MIEKVSHVRNPLTVIAMFAGLAEVSGTVVLPFLEGGTQSTYVWFLMGFPTLLVVLFFATLLFKHYVLYAPSDFRDDKLFAELFARGSGSKRVKKLDEEIADDATQAGAEIEQESPNGKEERVAATTGAEQPSDRDVRATALLAEELALAKLGAELGVQFERNVTSRARPSLMFDAVSVTPSRALAVEVKYTRRGVFDQRRLSDTFSRVESFARTLPEMLRRRFEFVFAVVVDGDAVERTGRLRATLERFAQEYPFSTRVEVYSLAELELEFRKKGA